VRLLKHSGQALRLCYGDSMEAAASSSLSPFERTYPSYGTTRVLDELRTREYPALAALGYTYLDYTAANLYATSQLERHFLLLRDHVFVLYFIDRASPAAGAGVLQRVG
jgi:hypothetical protein